MYAYYYVYKTGGLQENSTYPYTSYYDVTGTCDSDSDDFVVCAHVLSIIHVNKRDNGKVICDSFVFSSSFFLLSPRGRLASQNFII